MTTAQWPTAHSQRCTHCGAHVTRQFRRVFGDSDDVAHRCRECDTYPRLSEGSAAGVNVDRPDPEDTPSHRPNAASGWS